VSPTLPDVIVIRGAPGSGKSQTAKLLSARIGKGARVEVDTLRSMVFPVDWTNQAEHVSVLSLATSVVAGFVKLGHGPVVVVDTFSGDKVVKFLAELRDRHSPLDVRVFALVVAPDVLQRRRPAHQFNDVAVCRKLNADVVKHLQPYERLIDTSSMTPEEAANAVLAGCGWR
jgi:hypothetical protein